MNDAEAQRLLAGIDGPRPLPLALHDDLLATLTDATRPASVAGPRPLPDDLRHRLEATLITATARPVPPSLRRRVLGTTSPRAPWVLGAVAAALLLFVAGLVVTTRSSRDDGDQTAVQKSGPTTTAAAGDLGSGSAGSGSFDASGRSTAGADSGVAGPTASEGRTAQPVSPAAIPITVAGDDGSGIKAGFDAYLATVNAAGGINGRSVASTADPGGTATVDAGATVRPQLGRGV